MKIKKIVILHNIISPHVVSLFEKINEEKNLEVCVFFCSEKESNRIWDTQVKRKFNYKILSQFKIELGREDLFTYFINPTILWELYKFNPDIVICAGWDLFSYQMAFLFSKIFRKKFILWSGSTSHELSWRRTLTKPLVRLIISGSDAFIVYGSRAKEYLLDFKADPKKIFISYNSTDIESFSGKVKEFRKTKLKIKKELKIKTKNVVLYVGQLIERKGIKYLFKAFQKLTKEEKNVSFLVVGYGQLENNLKNYVKKNNLKNIIFTGGVEWKLTPKFYAISDLLVMPSLEEVWGLVVNEAMCSGLPVVATDVAGASADLIRNNENGFIIRPQSVEEIYLTMKKILISQKNLKLMGEKSLTMIKNFSQNITYKGVIEAINYASK